MVTAILVKQTFADLLTQLHREQYTGGILLQFGQGVPSEAQILKPDARIVLDKTIKKL